MSDHGHGHGQETEAAPQSLHLNHLLFFFSFFLFFYFFFTFCNVLTHQGTALLQSLPQRNLLSSARPEANTAHKSHPCIQTSASDPPPAPSIGCDLPTPAQEPLPEVTGRSCGQFCSSWSPSSPRKVLFESLLQNLEAAAVCTDGRCCPLGAGSVVHWKSPPPGSPGKEPTAQSSVG